MGIIPIRMRLQLLHSMDQVLKFTDLSHLNWDLLALKSMVNLWENLTSIQQEQLKRCNGTLHKSLQGSHLAPAITVKREHKGHYKRACKKFLSITSKSSQAKEQKVLKIGDHVTLVSSMVPCLKKLERCRTMLLQKIRWHQR